MILTGLEIVTRQLVRNLRNVAHQQQPCGVDLTLRQVSKWTSAPTIDLDNTKRQAAKTRILPFDPGESISLPPGAYLVDFNESVRVPTSCVGTVFARSSLWRSGVAVEAGIVDPGYEGALGALMRVENGSGVVLYRDAKLAQVVFEEVKGECEAYRGIYQGSMDTPGRDGAIG